MFLHSQWFSEKPSQPCIVFLHGLGGTSSLWKPIARNLSFASLALDQRGHGKSRPCEAQFTALDYGQDVIDTLKSLQIDSCYLVGHSMGVRTALAAGALQPDLFKGFVLVDLPLSKPSEQFIRLTDFLKKLPSSFHTRQAASEFLFQNAPDVSIARYLQAALILSIDKTYVFPFDKEALILTTESAQNTDLKGWLHDLALMHKHVLILRGAQSQTWPIELFLKDKEGFLHYSNIQFIEVSNAGHGLPFDQKEEFCRILEAFVNLKQK